MIGAILTGRYDGKARLAGMALAGAYIVSPIDFVPEAFLLWFGLVDDAAIAVWLAGAVLSETERFLTWERGRDEAMTDRAARRPAGTAPGRRLGGRTGRSAR